MFNALKYTRSLEGNGFDREQAEILVRMFMEMIEFNMFSKSDFEVYKSDFEVLNFDVKVLKSDVAILKSDVTTLQSDVTALKSDVTALKSDVTALKSDVAILKSDFESFRTDVERRFQEVEKRFESLEQKMDEKFEVFAHELDGILNRFGLKLTIKLGAMLALSVGLFSTILALKL